MPEDLTQDVVSLSKTERSGSLLVKTVATSSAFAGNHIHPLLYEFTLLPPFHALIWAVSKVV